MVEDKRPIHPSWWIDAAAKLNVLIGDEHDKLYDLEHIIAITRAGHIQDGDTAAAAKIKVEAMTEHREMQGQKGKIKQIEEFIRISKIRARLKDEEMRNY